MEKIMAENNEDNLNEEKCECGSNNDEEEYDEFDFILEHDKEELNRGVKDASFLLGFAGVLNNLGLSEEHIAELIKCKMSCDTDLKIAEISSKMNIEVMKNEKERKSKDIV